MSLITEIKALIEKEIRMEWRQKYAFNGVLLYVISSVYVCYMSFKFREGDMNVVTWNTLFWIIMLFASMNAVAKSFMLESKGRLLYLYSLVSPESIFLSKLIYNTFLLSILSGLALAFYTLVFGNPVHDLGLFIINVGLGAIGFSSTLTLISAVASKASNGATLMAILGFPLIIPMLLMLIKISKNAMDGLALASSYDEIIILGAINLIIVTLSYLLFPYLWRS